MCMSFSRSTNRRINRLQKRALSLMYGGYELTFEELLENNGSFTIYHYNILCIELNKVYHNLSQLFSVVCLHEHSASKNRIEMIKLNQVLWSNNLELSS